MEFPGFVNAYRDDEGYAHIYFFAGINEDGTPIYNDDISINDKFTHKDTRNEDGSIDIKFDDKNVVRIHCKLITIKNSIARYEDVTVL